MSNILVDLQDRKGKPCHLCNEMHIPQNRCRFEALASKIVRLTEANSLIPGLLASNKEATDLAENFRELLKRADQAHSILMEVLAENGDLGLQIGNTYLERLNEWANQSTSQGTSEKIHPSSPESSTPNESEAKPSTEETTSGESSPLIF